MSPNDDDQSFFGSLRADEDLDQDQLEREAMEAFLEAEGICPDCGGPGGQHAVRCKWSER